jgi:hypothetical protein
MDVLFGLAFPADIEGRVGLVVGVESEPVCNPLPYRMSHAAADHQGQDGGGRPLRQGLLTRPR